MLDGQTKLYLDFFYYQSIIFHLNNKMHLSKWIVNIDDTMFMIAFVRIFK